MSYMQVYCTILVWGSYKGNEIPIVYQNLEFSYNLFYKEKKIIYFVALIIVWDALFATSLCLVVPSTHFM